MSASDKGKQSMGGTLSRQPETDADEVFLHSLYTGTRAPKLALIPRGDAAKAAFLHQQFDAQRVHYRCEFPQADFDTFLHGGTPIGCLYLDRSGPEWRLLDIALVSGWGGEGLEDRPVARPAGRGWCGDSAHPGECLYSVGPAPAKLLPSSCQSPVGIKPTAKKNNRPPGGRAYSERLPPGGRLPFPAGCFIHPAAVLYTRIPGTQADRATNTA